MMNKVIKLYRMAHKKVVDHFISLPTTFIPCTHIVKISATYLLYLKH